MNNYVKKAKEIINKNKKKLIIGTSMFVVGVVGLGAVGITFVYNKAKLNTNYTIEQAQEIALEAVEGEVVKINKKLELELENFGFEYEFKIKDTNNILREVTVDATLGVITELDNYYD